MKFAIRLIVLLYVCNVCMQDEYDPGVGCLRDRCIDRPYLISTALYSYVAVCSHTLRINIIMHYRNV